MTLLITKLTYNLFYLQMTLLITANKIHICNVTLINFISKVIKSKVFINIVMTIKICSKKYNLIVTWGQSHKSFSGTNLSTLFVS